MSSFRRKLEESGLEAGLVDSSLVWQGIFPSKIEIFTWQLLKGRILVKDVLQKFSVS